MSKLSTMEPAGKKLLFAAFIVVIACACVFAGMGYHYLTYRNALMQNAVVRSGRMSVKMVASQLEQEIIAQEKKLILDVVYKRPERVDDQQLAKIKEAYPLIDQLFLHSETDSTFIGEGGDLRRWLVQRVKERKAEMTEEMLTLQHFSGAFNGRPVQAGFLLLPHRHSTTDPDCLIFTLDLEYIRKDLLEQSRSSAGPSSLDMTIHEDLRRTAGLSGENDIFLVEASFRDILPFWNISSQIDNLGIRERSRMEFFIYSYLIFFLFLLILLSVYFIWRQIQSERSLLSVKSQMLFHVSHELKTPLSLIRMYTETLMLGRVTGQSKTRDYHRTILAECDHLHLLINNTLDVSSIEKGIKEYHFVRDSFADTVRHVMSQYGDYLKQQGFSVRIAIDDPLPQSDFDKLAMSQVIANLIDNAVKFSPDEKKIDVRLSQMSSGLQLEISDSGVGIDPESLEEIFTPYNRLSSRFRGSGIGLSLVKHAVEAHGGTVYALSHEGMGSTFTVTLPRAEDKNVT